MADFKIAYGSEVALAVTALQSLASSATAGWSSAAIDNTSNLYSDLVLKLELDPADSAPANDAGFYLFGWGGLITGEYPTTGASTSGTMGADAAVNFPTIASAIQILPFKFIPYRTQNIAFKTSIFSMCDLLRVPFGSLPPFCGVGLLNYSGAALASSGNAVKYRGVFHTVS